MKKVFTLIAMALCAVGMSAQTESYAIATNFVPEIGQTVETTNVTLTFGGIKESYIKGDKTLTDNYSGHTKSNTALKGFAAYTEGNGNNPVYGTDNTAYTVENKTLPDRGTYYVLTTNKSGSLSFGFVLNANKPLFVVKSDGVCISDKITVTDHSGNNKALDENYKMTEKLTGGVCTFTAEKGNTYYVFSTGSKLGFYGYKFTPASEITATISDFGYSTFASAEALDFTGIEGLTAYTAAVNGNTVALTPVTKVSAGTGLVLKGTAGATYTIPAATVEGATESALKGVTEDGYTVETTDVVNYVLDNVDATPGFYKYTGTTIPAGKAYLQLPATAAAKSMKMVFGDATGISEVNAAAGEADGAYYTLGGQRVAVPTKGLYIHNGKKVIVK